MKIRRGICGRIQNPEVTKQVTISELAFGKSVNDVLPGGAPHPRSVTLWQPWQSSLEKAAQAYQWGQQRDPEHVQPGTSQEPSWHGPEGPVVPGPAQTSNSPDITTPPQQRAQLRMPAQNVASRPSYAAPMLTPGSAASRGRYNIESYLGKPSDQPSASPFPVLPPSNIQATARPYTPSADVPARQWNMSLPGTVRNPEMPSGTSVTMSRPRQKPAAPSTPTAEPSTPTPAVSTGSLGIKSILGMFRMM